MRLLARPFVGSVSCRLRRSERGLRTLYNVKRHLAEISLPGGRQTINSDDLKGNMLFFGYASCPDIRPTLTMAQLDRRAA